MFLFIRSAPAILALALASTGAHAQLSFTAAIDLALKHSPRLAIAQADVDRARAALQESHDVFIPSLVGGIGPGYSYGFPIGQPTLFNFSAQSLLYSASQQDYIHAARFGLGATNYALMDARAATLEETVLAFLALDFDLQRAAALADQGKYAGSLVDIVQERLNAGLDTKIDLTNAKLFYAQIRLAQLRNQDGTEYDRAHLARLTGLPEEGLSTSSASVPPRNSWVEPVLLPGALNSPSVLASYERAESKQNQALGDAKYEHRPQIGFGAQYSYFASYNNYSAYYLNFQHNNAAIGIQLTLPLFDAVRRARGRESAADAVRAFREADQQRDQFIDGRLRLKHATMEVSVRVEIAELDQQLAEQQLDAMLIQLQEGNGNLQGRQANPKDEQNARIAAKDRAITLLNTTFELETNRINLLRQTGQLESWLKSLLTGK